MSKSIHQTDKAEQTDNEDESSETTPIMSDTSSQPVSKTDNFSDDEGESGTKTFECQFCGLVFDDGASLGRHIGAKHRKESREFKKQQKEMKRKGLDIIAEVTSGMSEIEFISQNPQDGFYKLKEAHLQKLLDITPTSDKVKEFIMVHYNMNPVYKDNYNELSSLLKSAGMHSNFVDQTLKGLIAWESSIRKEMSPEQQGSFYYAGMSQPPSQFTNTGYFGAEMRYPNAYPQQPFGGYRPQGYPPGSPPGYPQPGRSPDAPMTMFDLLRVLDERDARKEKQDRLNQLEKQMNNMPKIIMQELKEMGVFGKKSNNTDEKYVTYEELVFDPSTGKPMINDDTGEPIKIKKSVPLSAMPTSPPNVGPTREIIELKNKIDRLTEQPRDDERIKEFKEILKQQKEDYEKLRDEMTKRERQSMEKHLASLEKQIDRLSQNQGQWKNDVWHAATLIADKGEKILMRRKPLSETVARIALGDERPTPTGSKTKAVQFADTEGLPIEDRTDENEVVEYE